MNGVSINLQQPTLRDYLRRMAVRDEIYLHHGKRDSIKSAVQEVRKERGWRFRTAEVNGRVIVWRVA